MNILHGYPVYRADAGAVSPDPSHPEIRWRCSRNINLGKFGLIAPTHFKSPTTSFSGDWSFRFGVSGSTGRGRSQALESKVRFADNPEVIAAPSVLPYGCQNPSLSNVSQTAPSNWFSNCRR